MGSVSPWLGSGALAVLAALAACGPGEDASAPPAEQDPAIEQALNDPLMIDPDLASRNEGNAALSGPPDGALPVPDTSPEEIAAARAEALALLGGRGNAPELPEVEAGEPIPPAAQLTAGARAGLLPGTSVCIDRLTYTFTWAARMPEAMPIYPRAAARESAGTDAGGCALRSIDFLTPVTVEDVLVFYLGRARQANLSARLVEAGEWTTLEGRGSGLTYRVDAREVAGGLTEVALVTRGGI